MKFKAFSIAVFALFFGADSFAQRYEFQHSSLPCLNKKFTIVVHIFRDSLGAPGILEADITAAVADINPFWKPIGASFEICEFRYHDNFQHDWLEEKDEMDEVVNKYHVERRINMYFVKYFPTDGQCGFASLNGIGDPEKSHIVIKKKMDCSTTSTIAHEMGHFFNLQHTFEGSGTENVDGSNCETEGDLICDTPADPFVEGDSVDSYIDKSNCRFINEKLDANGEFYIPDVGNVMSYYNCGECGFTWGQLDRMAKAYLASAIKFW